ncbi:aryl-alcohol dehydrogenase-like predicted oxidoreductase [Prauserella shujinwangii]|uniref:Aryl-alcohol dehydrogenase-like predicted oxidoreductase n=1 Tax=Prauserella shujinwangii TaxID=1453103 RepID=A0A2T0LTI7_9PSEU|nr:aldo/keto reductase [Prauserella shujinwangii]PRX47035.1 aryl-alcohol dehydrogenase-like predicted oxidoreductase [Prauserella shujinwangii]
MSATSTSTARLPGFRVPGVDVPVSGLVLGTMTFGDTVDADGAQRMLDVALDAGITAVDTANGYAGGRTEEILRPLLAGRRDRIVLASKAGMPHPDAGEASPLSAAGLRAAVEGSLRRLGVDHLDLLYLHQPDRAVTLHETLTEVAALVAEGKVGALGVSNYAAWQIVRLGAVADEVGAPRPAVAQQLHNLLARRLEEEYAEMALSSGLRTMVYNPLGGGLLAGGHRFDEHPREGRFGDSRLAEMYRRRYWNEQLFDAVAELARIAGQAGIPLVELALRWLLSRPTTDAVLLGGSRPAHLESNIACLARGPLAADVVEACDQVGARLRGPMPAYHR